MTPRLSSFLNASRWIAAYLVLVHHVRHLALADFRDVVHRTIFAKGLYFITGLGHEAVMVFFVVSGYLVGGLAITRFSKRGFDVVDYLVHRTSRIYTVLIPALVLGGLLDLIGLIYFNHSQLYTASAQYRATSLNFTIPDNLNIPTLLANLAMLEGIVSPRLGSNGPLWSLVYEWWYYLIFAAGMVAVVKGPIVWRVAAGISLVAMLLLLPHVLVLWGVMWLVGLGAALYAETHFWKPPWWLGLLVFFATLIATRLGHSSENSAAATGIVPFLTDFGLAVAFAFAVLSFKDGKSVVAPAGGHEYLANFSYSVYLLHFPMAIFTMAMLNDAFGVRFLKQPDAAGLAYFAGVAIVVFSYTWIVSRFTETHTSQVRRFLLTLLRRPTTRPVNAAEPAQAREVA